MYMNGKHTKSNNGGNAISWNEIFTTSDKVPQMVRFITADFQYTKIQLFSRGIK